MPFMGLLCDGCGKVHVQQAAYLKGEKKKKVFSKEQRWLRISEIAVLLTVTLEDPQAW